MFDTFDINDIVHMSKIADHYLGEYEALLNSSEMQASNVGGNFRALNFTDADISGIDYNSDDWANDSVAESSETSGELTNSLGEAPEYKVTAGRKPLSIVIRRCSTPSSANSSPSRRPRTDSSSTHAERCVPSSSKCTENNTSEVSSLTVRLSHVPEESTEEEERVSHEVLNKVEEEGSSLLRDDDANGTVESTSSPPENQRDVPEENAVDNQSVSNDVSCGSENNSYVIDSQKIPDRIVMLENSGYHDERSFSSVQDESYGRTLDSSFCSTGHVLEENTEEEISQLKQVASETETVPADTINKDSECQAKTEPFCAPSESISSLVCGSDVQSTSVLLGQHGTDGLKEENLCLKGECVKENDSLNSECKEEVNNEETVQSNKSVSELSPKADPEIPDPYLSSTVVLSSNGIHSKTDELANPEREGRNEALQPENEMCATNDEEDNLESKFKVSYTGENSHKNTLDDVELIINADVANTPEKIRNETAPCLEPPSLEAKGNAQKKQNCSTLDTMNPLFIPSPIALSSEAASMLSLPVPLAGASFFSQDCLANRASACIVENFAELPLEGSCAVLDTIKSECNGSLPLDSDNLIDISSVVYGSDMLGNSSCAEYSPLLFSSDDESPSFKDEVKKRIEAALAPSPGYAAVISHEKTRLSKLQEILIGAPPPPSITMPHHSVTEMLKLLKEREDLMVQAVGGPSTSVLLAVREAASAVWPKVKYCQYHGIHYNHSVISESYEAQCQKLQERCVGNETASSCTLWSYSSSNTSSKEKRPVRKQTSGASPGRRLSHLAQRQRTFSSSNLLLDRRLQNVLPNCGPERRTIMVNVKKKSARKPKSSQKKKSAEKAERSRSVASAKLNSSKRALFQSPEEEKKKGSSLSKFRVSENRSSEMRSRRALFVDDSAGNEKDVVTPSRKRKREETEENVRKMPRRMLFADSEPSTAAEPQKQTGGRLATLRNSQKVPEAVGKSGSSTEISSYHKKKLLWAVAEALKQKGIGTLHPSFRACAAALASRCRVHIHKLLADRRGSTSDRMFALACEYVGEVIANTDKNGDKGT